MEIKIKELFNKYDGYVDRSMTEKAISECNYDELLQDIVKIIHSYREKMCDNIISEIRNGNLDTVDEIERELIYYKTK